MEAVPVKILPRGWGDTQRQEIWWIEPVVVVIVLGGFLIYGTWAAYQNAYYTFGPYLSPFYAPELWGASEHAWFGPKPDWWPSLLPFSPALLILPFPGLFRVTCYYYRGAYYKGFWSDPPSCTVGEPRGTSYWGERWFPLVLQNVHRYFAYIAVLFLLMLSYDVWLAVWWDDGAGGKRFGVGLGTIVLAINVVLLSSYTLGCHSIRHLVGGRKDEVYKSALRSSCYNCTSSLNRRHQLFAWSSLFSVALSDVYIRLCSMGILSDPRIF